MAKMVVGKATAFEEDPPRAEDRPPGRAVRGIQISIPDKANVEASKAKAERSAAN